MFLTYNFGCLCLYKDTFRSRKKYLNFKLIFSVKKMNVISTMVKNKNFSFIFLKPVFDKIDFVILFLFKNEQLTKYTYKRFSLNIYINFFYT